MRWIAALVCVTLLGGALRAREAATPDARQSVDERGYVGVAAGLARTGRYGRQSLHWAPGAPVMFALAARLAGGSQRDIPAAYWEQWAVGTALIPLVFLLALRAAAPPAPGRGRTRAGDDRADRPTPRGERLRAARGAGLRAASGGARWAALAAAFVVATYPPLVAVGGDLLSEPLGALLFTAAMASLLSGRPALAGGLLGAAVLTRANLLVCVPAIALFAPPRFLAAALIPVVVWSLNVSIDTGRPVIVANDGGSSLFVGTFTPGGGTLRGAKRALGMPHASGRAAMDAVAARDPAAPREVALREEAWRNVVRDPLGVVAMMPAKLARMWMTTSRTGGTPLRAWHLLLLALALAGLTRAPRALVAALLAFAAFHLVAVAMPRYALPVMPVVIAAGAGGWGRRLAKEPAPRADQGVVVDRVNVSVLL